MTQSIDLPSAPLGDCAEALLTAWAALQVEVSNLVGVRAYDLLDARPGLNEKRRVAQALLAQAWTMALGERNARTWFVLAGKSAQWFKRMMAIDLREVELPEIAASTRLEDLRSSLPAFNQACDALRRRQQQSHRAGAAR